jgi:SAM-dependent methyltransferase
MTAVAPARSPTLMERLGKLSPMRVLGWDHTGYYHPMLLRHVPTGAERALDVGCGTGQFARLLAERVKHVDAVDVSDDVLALARERSAHVHNLHLRTADITTDDIGREAYDFVSCLMCIHHVPFEPALEKLAAAVRPGGVLAVLGLGRLDPIDLPLALGILPLDIVMGIRFKAAKALGRPTLTGSRAAPEFPVEDATMRLSEVREASAALLPSATFTRHVFYRYSLVYRRPG